MTEVSAYHMLREFWGKYVPPLVSYGTAVGGTVMYIATEEFNGYEMGMGMSLVLLFVYCSIVKLVNCFLCAFYYRSLCIIKKVIGYWLLLTRALVCFM